jgi:hypothetical protein
MGFGQLGGLGLIEASRCHSASLSALAMGLGCGHLMLVSVLWWQGGRITTRLAVLTTLVGGAGEMVLAFALMRAGEPSEMILAPAACAVGQVAVAVALRVLWRPICRKGWDGWEDGGWS